MKKNYYKNTRFLNEKIYIGCSLKQSSSVYTGRAVGKRLKEEGREGKIICIDSMNASIGEGMLAIEAAKMAAEGLSRLPFGNVDIPSARRACRHGGYDRLAYYDRIYVFCDHARAFVGSPGHAAGRDRKHLRFYSFLRLCAFHDNKTQKKHCQAFSRYGSKNLYFGKKKEPAELDTAEKK